LADEAAGEAAPNQKADDAEARPQPKKAPRRSKRAKVDLRNCDIRKLPKNTSLKRFVKWLRRISRKARGRLWGEGRKKNLRRETIAPRGQKGTMGSIVRGWARWRSWTAAEKSAADPHVRTIPSRHRLSQRATTAPREANFWKNGAGGHEPGGRLFEPVAGPRPLTCERLLVGRPAWQSGLFDPKQEQRACGVWYYMLKHTHRRGTKEKQPSDDSKRVRPRLSKGRSKFLLARPYAKELQPLPPR